MFLDELTPLFKEVTKQPIAFFGGLFSGVLNLKPTEDPLKSWLEKQEFTAFEDDSDNDSDSGPQSITID